MFDDLDDVEEFTVNPRKPDAFAAELLSAAEAGNVVRQKMLLGSLDDGLEVAVHTAGQKLDQKAAFGEWLHLLVHSIGALASKSLTHFVWEAPGKEKVGAALVRRLQSTVNSGTFDAMKVEKPTGTRESFGIVLMLGRGGTSFDDLDAPEAFWKERGYTVIRANHCCIQRLKEREMDRILQALVDSDVAKLGLIGHFFSENGSYFWCHVLERWEKCPPAGLPPLSKALRGCIYDSCHIFAGPTGHSEWIGARGDEALLPENRKIAKKGSARHVTMNAMLAMARNVFGPEDQRTLNMADVSGPVFKGIVDVHAHRGSSDDPIFDNGAPDQMKGHLQEPVDIPRIVFISKADVTLPWYDAVCTAKWMEENRKPVEFELYETAMNCSMHRDDPMGYFGRVSEWHGKLPPYDGAGEA